MAARRSQGVAIGTLIGSNITDPLLSIGIAGLIHPLAITAGGYDLNTIQITRIASTGTENTDLLVQCNNSNFA